MKPGNCIVILTTFLAPTFLQVVFGQRAAQLAVDGQATCILSSAKDLLVLHPFQGIEILTPADF